MRGNPTGRHPDYGRILLIGADTRWGGFGKASLNGAIIPEGLTPALERTLTVSASGLPVESVAKSAEQTVQTARNQQLMVTGGLVVAGIVFLASFMPIVDPHDRWLIYP